MTTTLFLVAGTWGGRWARETDPQSFRVFLRLAGNRCSVVEWTENVDGVPDVFAAQGNRDWIAGGYAQRGRLYDELYEDRNLLTHSHGIGVTLYQAVTRFPDDPKLTNPVPVRNVLAICPPPREEYFALAKEALDRGTIGALRVIYADGWDLWARLGQIGDRHFGWRRSWDGLAHPRFFQRGEQGIGHSGIFAPDERDRLIRGGDVRFLQTARVEVAGV